VNWPARVERIKGGEKERRFLRRSKSFKYSGKFWFYWGCLKIFDFWHIKNPKDF